MQGMLSQFRGLEVDWRHGKVRPSKGGGAAREMTVDGEFWRDLEWFDDHFERRNCSPLFKPPVWDIWGYFSGPNEYPNNFGYPRSHF